MKIGEKLYTLLGKRYGDCEIVSEISCNTQEVSFYFKALAFYIGVSYIAEMISKCPIKVFDRGKDSVDTAENSSNIDYKRMNYIFNYRPNPNENAIEFKKKIVFKLYYENEALIFMYKDHFYIADSYGIEYHPLEGNIYTDISLENESTVFTRKSENIILFRLDDENVKHLVNGMLEEYNKILDKAFKLYDNNGTKYKYISAAPEVGNEDFIKKNNESKKLKLKDFIENPNGIFFGSHGIDIQKVNEVIRQSDDILNIRKDMFETAAQALKMPVTMLYGNVTNYKDLINGWASFSIEPLAKIIDTELTIKTIPPCEVMRGSRFMVDTTMLMHLDFFDMCEKAQHAIGNGTHNIDDVREKMGDNKLNTEYSRQHWLSKNYDRVENIFNSDIDKKN